MVGLIVPKWPVGAPVPAVIRVQVIGDGTNILSTQYVEVRVPTDRGQYMQIELRMDLADGNGTVAHAIAVALDAVAQDTRRQIAKGLDLAGFVEAGVYVLQGKPEQAES